MRKCNSERFGMQLGCCDVRRLTRAALVLVCLGVFYSPTSGMSADGKLSFTDVNDTDCETILACYREPEDCETERCDFLLTWDDTSPTVINFQMSATVPETEYWIGFGMSLDNDMGDDGVISCVYNAETGRVSVESSWNDGLENLVFKDPHVGLVEGSISGEIKDGRIMCRFDRVHVFNGTWQEDFGTIYPLDVPNTAYHVVLAKGPARNGIKQEHTWVSGFEVEFTDFVSVEASPGDEHLERKLIKAHGILMMFAWMVFAGFGMLLPRYYKSAWPKALLFGKKAWFQLHRGVMTSGLLLTAAGFIIIFVAERKYSKLPSPTVAHPPLGIIVMILVLANPIMALFRPDPDSNQRPLFNVAHFFVGLMAHVVAAITMLLGMWMPVLDDYHWCKWVMGAFICFHVLTEIVLTVHMNVSKCRGRSSDRNRDKVNHLTAVNYQQVRQSFNGSPSGNKEAENPGCFFKTIVLAVYLVVVLGFCIAISIQLGAAKSNAE